MTKDKQVNEIIDLISEIIINHLSKKRTSIDNTDKFKKL